MNNTHNQLAPNLKTSKILTGLWQVADMERGGKQLDLDKCLRNYYNQIILCNNYERFN